MILPVYLYGQPVLRKEAEEVPMDYPDLKQLVANMFETMYNADSLSTQPPFAKHASFLALLMADLERAGRLNQQQEQLMQEAILALISFRIDEAVHLPYRQ